MIPSTEELSKQVRIDILNIVYKSGASHIGSAFSTVDILAVLYGQILRYQAENPILKERDRFIMSKGHAASALYAILSNVGFFPKAILKTYSFEGSVLLGHVSHHVPGVELSTGALGHGLSVGAGMALSAKSDQKNRVFVLLGDGELNEGSNWEAFLFAAHHKLDNLIVIIDYNKIQGYGDTNDIMMLEPLSEKLAAFGCHVHEIDGHNHNELLSTLSITPKSIGKPTVVIAHTIKGKGVSFMENQLAWHYKNPNEEQYKKALKELS
jgi:transketolase